MDFAARRRAGSRPAAGPQIADDLPDSGEIKPALIGARRLLLGGTLPEDDQHIGLQLPKIITLDRFARVDGDGAAVLHFEYATAHGNVMILPPQVSPADHGGRKHRDEIRVTGQYAESPGRILGAHMHDTLGLQRDRKRRCNRELHAAAPVLAPASRCRASCRSPAI